jgi:hypothetical protein
MRGGPTCDVFLSYAREDEALIRAPRRSGNRRLSVWYDKDLVRGDRYRDRIRARIDALMH